MDSENTLQAVIKECGMSKDEADVFCLLISTGGFDKELVLRLANKPTRDKYDKAFNKLIKLGFAWEE